MISQTEFQQRRAKLLSLLPENAVVIIANGAEKIRKGDSNYPFTPDSNFYYLTGFVEAEAMAIISREQYLLFCQNLDSDKERWLGKRIGTKAAVQHFYADAAFTLDKFKQQLYALLTDNTVIYSVLDNTDLKKCFNVCEYVTQDLLPFIGECRLVKSESEIALMQQAATISSKAHTKIISLCKPDKYEFQLEADFIHACATEGARFQSYPPIFASGINACTLHYEKNEQQLQHGQLILIDAGCEYQHYASDITRTLPVSGKFTAEQKAIYQLVLNTQLAIIELIKPGIKLNVLQKTTIYLLTSGLVELGLLQGKVEQLIKQKAYFDFYMHGVSHWLGLDTHDLGQYKINGEFRALQAGNVLTVEPGIYIAEDNMQVEAKWRGIGVRIEDDVLVTQQGYKILSDVPKTIAAIEQLMMV